MKVSTQVRGGTPRINEMTIGNDPTIIPTLENPISAQIFSLDLFRRPHMDFTCMVLSCLKPNLSWKYISVGLTDDISADQLERLWDEMHIKLKASFITDSWLSGKPVGGTL